MAVRREIASAKINLYLHVTGKRSDGYHLLDSLVAFAETGDMLEAALSPALTLTVTGPFASHLGEGDNSALKAARALQAACQVQTGAALTLDKQLPVAAGIGGGSADAAAALRLLTRAWDVKLEDAVMQALALSLGADVPACLRSSSLYMSGIGETIEPGPDLHGLCAVLVNPLVPLSTPEVFACYRQEFSLPAPHATAFSSQQECLGFLQQTRNDLEPAAIQKLPLLTQVLAALDGCTPALSARMSGSGATCFALFSTFETASSAAGALGAAHPDWWVKAARIH